MKYLSTPFILLFISVLASAKPANDPHLAKFVGKWESVSQACIVGSKLKIARTELRYADDPAAKKFSLKHSAAGSVWVELSGAAACKTNCESPYYHFEVEPAPNHSWIRVSTSDTFSLDGKESGKASCTYKPSISK